MQADTNGTTYLPSASFARPIFSGLSTPHFNGQGQPMGNETELAVCFGKQALSRSGLDAGQWWRGSFAGPGEVTAADDGEGEGKTQVSDDGTETAD